MLFFLFLAVAATASAGEFIYDQAPFASCHASTLVETKPGEILAAWFGGSAEGKPDVAIWSARRSGSKWSTPVEVVREPQIATYNPVLFFSRDRTLWLFYKFGPSPMTWTGGVRSSRNEGRTWTPIAHLPAGLYGPIKNKPLLLPDGTIVSGVSVESYKTWTAWVERSTDNGKTWTKHGPIVYPATEFGIIQPAIVPLGRNRIRMYLRSTAAIGKICYADSSDGGKTWTDAKPTTLPNPNSGIDAVGLKDGRIVLVYNHTEKGRSPLNVSVTKDGDTWNPFRALETEPGEFSYPAVIQSSDGNLHITYTWNRKKIRYVEIPLADIPK